MEDLHSRTISSSRSLAGSYAWRAPNWDGGVTPIEELEDCGPINPTQYRDNSNLITKQSGIPSFLPPARNGQGNSSPTRYHNHGEPEYFAHTRTVTSRRSQGFNNFLERAHCAIAKDHRHAPDPFVEGSSGPSHQFGTHSHSSSVESISSIVDEKAKSPLNKPIASVCHLYPVLRLSCCTHRYRTSLQILKDVPLLNFPKNYRCSIRRIQRVDYRSRDT